jgi:hypothetical protein
MTNPEWRQFEVTVASFISALDPRAKVTHDAMIPDVDTGKLRQRDIWIETKVCDHFPLKILVSCKRYSCKINEQHMDAFIGELLSSGAQKGIIYSFSGFTVPAIKKAHAKGISCCRLYQNEPPNLPDSLLFDAYLLTPTFHFNPIVLEHSTGQPETVNELLDLSITGLKSEISVIDFIEQKYYEQRKRVRSKARKTGEVPSEWTDLIAITDPETERQVIIIKFGGSWDYYEARLEGYLLNGSYSFTEMEFKGKQSFPSIDKHGPDPGNCWKQIDRIPKHIERTALVGVLYGGKVSLKESLRAIGNKKIIKS